MKKLLFITLLLSSLQTVLMRGAACPEPGAGAAAATASSKQDILDAVEKGDVNTIEALLQGDPRLGMYFSFLNVAHLDQAKSFKILKLREEYFNRPIQRQVMLDAVKKGDVNTIEALLKDDPKLWLIIERKDTAHFDSAQREHLRKVLDRYYYPRKPRGLGYCLP